jgi:hypothetical protein
MISKDLADLVDLYLALLAQEKPLFDSRTDVVSPRDWDLSQVTNGISRIIQKGNHESLAAVGAGPLEEFFEVADPSVFFSLIQDELARNPRLREAFEQSWDLPPRYEILRQQ